MQCKTEVVLLQDYSEAHEQLSLLGTNLSADPVDLSMINGAPEYVITATEVELFKHFTSGCKAIMNFHSHP